MDKKTFCLLLEGSLLCFDGVKEEELIQEYNFTPTLAKASYGLYLYLNSKNLNCSLIIE